MAMITFQFSPVNSKDSYRRNHIEAFAEVYPEHHAWLDENDIDYRIDIFHWPQLPMRGASFLVCEFSLIIETIPHAIMFRLYSGMSPVEVLPHDDT